MIYDHYAVDPSTRIGRWLTRGYMASVAKFARLKPGEKILDIGAGRGYLGDWCANHGVDYYAVDCNSLLVERMKKRGLKATTLTVPPLPEGGWDAIVCVSMFEHLDGYWQVLDLLKDGVKVLAPKGRWIVGVPDWHNSPAMWLSEYTHTWITTSRRMRDVCRDAGLKTRFGWTAGPIRGWLGFFTSCITSVFPLSWLANVWPNSWVLHKAWKLQTTFLRMILVEAKE